MIYKDAMIALADPSRQAIVERLRSGPLPVGQIADTLPISRPAVSQHLKVLSDAGLLTCSSQGNRRFYAISPDGIAALRSYLDTLWDDALNCFEDATHSIKKETP